MWYLPPALPPFSRLRKPTSRRGSLLYDVEAALADAEVTSGVVPTSCVAPIHCAIIAADAVDAGNVVIPVVRHLTARVATIDADAARYVHWGATSQDILDTGLVLQLRAAVLAAALRAPGLVATMLGAMVQEHERGLGGWQAEWDTLRDLVLVTRMAAPPERHLESLLDRAPTLGNRTSFGRPMPGFHNASRRSPVLLARPPTLVIGPPGTAANLLDTRSTRSKACRDGDHLRRVGASVLRRHAGRRRRVPSGEDRITRLFP